MPTTELVERLRAVKDPDEVAAIRGAAELAPAAFAAGLSGNTVEISAMPFFSFGARIVAPMPEYGCGGWLNAFARSGSR